MNNTYKVTLTYYCTLIVTLIAAMAGFYITTELGIYIPKGDTAHTAIHSLLIMFTICTIPLALKFFANNTKQIQSIENEEEKQHAQVRNGIIRVSLIGLGFTINILFFYLLQEKTMIYMAGISAIALFFAKPRKERNY